MVLLRLGPIMTSSRSLIERDYTLSARIDLDLPIENLEGDVDLFLILNLTNSSWAFLFSRSFCISAEYCSFYIRLILSKT